jgi:hypothetical protein
VALAHMPAAARSNARAWYRHLWMCGVFIGNTTVLRDAQS